VAVLRRTADPSRPLQEDCSRRVQLEWEDLELYTCV